MNPCEIKAHKMKLTYGKFKSQKKKYMNLKFQHHIQDLY